MTTISTHYAIALDEGWVDHILVTSFDSQYGSCWYWCEDDSNITQVRLIDSATVDPVITDVHLLEAVEIDVRAQSDIWRIESMKPSAPTNGRACRIDRESLSWACGKILSDERLSRTEAARQLRTAITEPDELPDLDAESCDVIVQVAAFGTIAYG